jgi:predicted nucleotidyltransferase
MRRATITLPDDLDRELEAFRASQAGRPSLTSLAEIALRRFLSDPAADGADEEPPLISRILSNRAAIKAIACRHRATHVRLFGSVARGEAAAGSDVDFLVTLEPGSTLFDLAALRAELEGLLDVAVDVVSDSGLEGTLRDEILDESLSL